MKFPKCQSENKDGVKTCRKCGTDLNQPPLWKPTWQWHLRVLAAIYVVLIIVFFALNSLLKPYLRQIPKDITPWLKDVPKQERVG